MSEQVVTISKVFKEHGVSKKDGSPWTRYDVKDAGGNKYQTFNAELGAQADAATGQSVTVSYHEETRGQYTNYVLDAIKTGGAVNTETANDAPSPESERQLRIMRQSGLERAILASKALGIDVSSVDDLYEISDQFVDYFVNGAPVDARL